MPDSCVGCEVELLKCDSCDSHVCTSCVEKCSKCGATCCTVCFGDDELCPGCEDDA